MFVKDNQASSFFSDRKGSIGKPIQPFESFLKDSKGQGALEYLLIIGGAILIAAIVIGILAKSGSQAKNDANQATSDYNGVFEQGRGMIDTNLDVN